MISIEGIGVEKVGQSQSEGPAKGNNQRSVKFHKPVNKWDRLPACHVQNDRLEAYPTFKDAPELKSGANEQRRSATLAIRTSPGSLQAPQFVDREINEIRETPSASFSFISRFSRL